MTGIDNSAPTSVGTRSFEEEQARAVAERSRAVRVVAAASDGPEDCRMLLDILGLRAVDGRKGTAVV